MSESVVRVRGVDKVFGAGADKTPALQQIDLEIRHRTNNQRTLLDVFHYLLKNNGLPKPGFEDKQGFRSAVETQVHSKPDARFRISVRGTVATLREIVDQQVREGELYEKLDRNRVRCYACGHCCPITDGQPGVCKVRYNRGGTLYVPWGYVGGVQCDPIEKKPLNHFLPGTRVFSMGTAGCNMGCFFCQNWDISKSRQDQVRSQHIAPEDVPLLALQNGCDSLAFTYNEPTIWGEYVIDICKAAREYGLKTVMVSNGYITYEAFHDIYDHIDAANIDLKAFTEGFYGKTTLTHLQPVLETLEWLKKETKVWFEITNLMIPTLNDDPAETRQLSEWILMHLGPDVPLHFTAFHPDFKLQDKPRTPPETLHRARAIALETGLHYVYEGNIFSDGANTCCPKCGELLIRRSWHDVLENRLVEGACPKCSLSIPGVWEKSGGPLSSASRIRKTAGNYDHLNL